MTNYTASDFAKAEFARSAHRDVLAVRAYPRESAPWLLVWRLDGKARCDDATMAHSGSWVPVQENPRPLAPDAITDEMVERARRSLEDDGWIVPEDGVGQLADALTAALTESPARPEGAEKVEAVLHQYWSGDINGDDLADRIAEEMNR